MAGSKDSFVKSTLEPTDEQMGKLLLLVCRCANGADEDSRELARVVSSVKGFPDIDTSTNPPTFRNKPK